MTQIQHPIDPADVKAMAGLRAHLAEHPVTEMTRELYDEQLEQIPDFSEVRYERGKVGGVPGTWCRPAAARANAVILYLHGGAYVFGSAWAHRHFVGQLAGRARVSAFIADYRLAPEHPFPAAVNDSRAAFRALEGTVFVVGDSAGAALALDLLADPERRPAAGILFSPWTDLALTGKTIETRAAEDPFLSRKAIEPGVKAYLQSQDPRTPLASPLYAKLASLPPVQAHVGTAEILLDDSLRLEQRTNIELHVWEGMPHVFPRNVETQVGARAALELASEFVVSST